MPLRDPHRRTDRHVVDPITNLGLWMPSIVEPQERNR